MSDFLCAIQNFTLTVMRMRGTTRTKELFAVFLVFGKFFDFKAGFLYFLDIVIPHQCAANASGKKLFVFSYVIGKFLEKDNIRHKHFSAGFQNPPNFPKNLAL